MSRNGAQRESSATRDQLEKAFERWGAFTCRHAWSVIVTVAVLSLGLAYQIFSLKVDNSMEAFLHGDDPIRIERLSRFGTRHTGRMERPLVVLNDEGHVAAIGGPFFLWLIRKPDYGTT